MYLIGIPLLLIPFAIYNIFAFLMPLEWTKVIFTITMISGGVWTISPQDLLMLLSIVLLFGEIFKSARASSNRGLIDHMLSFALFMVMGVEFLLVARAATSTFFLLLMLELVDVLSGFTIASRTARRDVTVEPVSP